MKLKLPPNPESRPIVAEQKSPDSRSIVAEALTQTESNKKQSRSEYHKTWAKDKAQISFRITTEFKEQIDQHTKSRKEPLAQFVIRAIKEQIERDNAE